MSETGPPSSKDSVRATFGRAAATYGGIGPPFIYFGRVLVNAAGLQPGWRVLDVATGRGAVLFPAGEQVGPSGSVLGIDLAAPMVELLQADIVRNGIMNAEACEMDAEELRLPDESFDAVTCGFILMFLPNLAAALSEFFRVLRPGGVVAASSWAERDPRWDWYDAMTKRYVPTAPNAQGRQARILTTASELMEPLAAAGFVDLEVITEPQDVVYRDEETWWSALMSHAGRAPIDRMTPEKAEQFKAEAFERIQSLREKDGFHEVWEALIVTGRRPA